MNPKTDLEYVEFFAIMLHQDNSLFVQQKRFIEAQFTSSSSLFRNMFAGEDFKTEARKYLRKMGRL